MTLPTRPNTPSQAHLQGTQSRDTKANLAKEPALCQRTAHRTPADEYLSSFVRHFSKISLLDTKAHPPPNRMKQNQTIFKIILSTAIPIIEYMTLYL
jgi:hypothetical protein